MGKTTRDWTQLYSIYGMDDQLQTFIFLLFHAITFSLLSLLFFLYFPSICSSLDSLSLLPPGAARFSSGFFGAVTALSAVCLFVAAANFLYSAGPLRWEMAQRMVNAVADWSNVKTVLDVGCGRGILLNAVAMQLKKEGSSGRVVGLDQGRCRWSTMKTLKTAGVEGVQEYVTCREGDVKF